MVESAQGTAPSKKNHKLFALGNDTFDGAGCG